MKRRELKRELNQLQTFLLKQGRSNEFSIEYCDGIIYALREIAKFRDKIGLDCPIVREKPKGGLIRKIGRKMLFG